MSVNTIASTNIQNISRLNGVETLDIAFANEVSWSPVVDSNGDLINHVFTNLTGWTNQDQSSGVTSIVTHQGETCAKFYGGDGIGNDKAQQMQDVGSLDPPSVFTMGADINLELLGDTGNKGLTMSLYFHWTGQSSFDQYVTVQWRSTGVWINDFPSPYQILNSSYIDYDAWHRWVIQWDVNDKGSYNNCLTSIWYDNVKVAHRVNTNQSDSGTTGLNGDIYVQTRSRDGFANATAYIESIKFGTGLVLV